MVFFQAEDGIRDLVRSRGLGDVYKRQRHTHRAAVPARAVGRRRAVGLHRAAGSGTRRLVAGSSAAAPGMPRAEGMPLAADRTAGGKSAAGRAVAVSYTHLTLPTSDLV